MKAIPIAVLLLSFVIILTVPSAHAQLPEPENFSVSPADFTVRNVSPLGEPYLIEQKLRIHNGANIERNFLLSVRTPPQENLEPGYEAIPNENWIILIPTLIPIEENSDNLVNMGFEIPRWENLTGQRWEAWISVKRIAEPGEILEIELISVMKIETTEELPPPPSQGLPLSMIIIAVVVVVAVVIAGVWIWSKKTAGGTGEMPFSRSWG